MAQTTALIPLKMNNLNYKINYFTQWNIREWVITPDEVAESLMGRAAPKIEESIHDVAILEFNIVHMTKNLSIECQC